jgi:tetratricopeptide (TPR) repeat protein
MLAAFLPLLLACAPKPAGLAFEPVVITGGSRFDDVSGASNAEIVDEAAERRLRGDTAGALARLALVLSQAPPPPEAPLAHYQRGLCLEREERFEDALASYHALLQGWPAHELAQDGWFRAALCQEYLGRHREALRSLARVREDEGLDLHDRLTLDLQRGISLLRAGHVRRGARLLEQSLAAAEGSALVGYLQAKAHVSLARTWLEQGASLGLDGPQRRQARHLERRARGVAAAEREVTAATRFEEPEWILEGLLLLGDAYLSLADELLGARAPRGLSPEALAIFREQLAERAGLLTLKAWKHYDLGVSKAEEWRWDGRPLARLREARDAIDLAALALDEAPAPPTPPPPDPPSGTP